MCSLLPSRQPTTMPPTGSPPKRDWLYKLLESHKDPRFAIDLSEVNYLASSEIGFLVTINAPD